MKRLTIAVIMLGAMLWAVEPWTGVCGPVPWWVMDNTGAMSGAKFRGICVINDSLVWVVGENGKVYKRTGGVHSHQWVSVTIPGASGYHLNDVCVIGSNIWIVGEKRTDPNKYRGIIYKTTNGGTTWDSVIPLPVPPNLPTPFLKVKMAWASAIGNYVGYIAGGNGVILYSEDGGNSWVRRPSPWPGKDSISVWYNGLWMDTADPYCKNVWVSGDAFGILAKSTNSGSNWTACSTSVFSQSYTFPPPTGTPYGTKLGFFDMDFSNPNVGYVALSYGRIGKTTNGGASWTVTQYEPQATWFYDVAKGKGDTAFAVGNFGVVHRFDGDNFQECVSRKMWKIPHIWNFSTMGKSVNSSITYAGGIKETGGLSIVQCQQFSLCVENVDFTDFVFVV